MAQRDEKPPTIKERPISVKLRTSLSQPSPPIESKPNPHRHFTLPEPLNSNNYPQSRAELYVAARSQMFSALPERKDLSPQTPTSTAFSTNSPFPPVTHAEMMSKWQQQKKHELCKKQKHQYFYDAPPPKSPTGLSSTFPPWGQLASRKNDPPSSKTNESRSKLKQSSAV